MVYEVAANVKLLGGKWDAGEALCFVLYEIPVNVVSVVDRVY